MDTKELKIAVAGTGYVGLSIATLLSQHHQVTAVDVIPEKVDMLNRKQSPIQDEYIEKYLSEKALNLTATLDGAKAYILCPEGLHVGDTVISGTKDIDIKPGNCLPIANIPVGTVIHNVEMHPGKGAQLVRSAGAYAQLMAKEGENAQIRMPSGEVRIIRTNCTACIGQVGNLEHENVQIGKAGRKRHMGWRPTVRGSVMNPCDHPHGGGEGKAPVGRPGPVTPWGKPALGYKTRKTKNPTDKFIVKRRNVK